MLPLPPIRPLAQFLADFPSHSLAIIFHSFIRPDAMYRPGTSSIFYRRQPRWQKPWARLLMPLTLWICVFVSVRYGYYGNCRMVLGPSSARLIKASSVFVKQVEVRDYDKKQVFLYGYSEKPELSQELNWSVSDYVIVGSYSRQGFTLWLNKGSKIQMRLEAQPSSLMNLEVGITKGERQHETLRPNPATVIRSTAPTDLVNVTEAEYTIEEDDKYYLGLANRNSRSIILTMHLKVSSKMYDTSKATSMCSSVGGSCRLKLGFPSAQYVTVMTPNGGLSEWYIQLSFVARVFAYIVILGFVVIVVFLILKYMGPCDGETSIDNTMVDNREVATERVPITSTKQINYGTGEEEEALSSSSEDLYDGKVCVICYDEQRNCFFVPCGHCATCYSCAQRIMAEGSTICPICRRLIHKVRRLFNS